jgi:SAM-dependent methyltransferase
MAKAAHWDGVHGARRDSEHSWFEDEPALSLELVLAHAGPAEPVIDIGAGTSRLADRLLARGYADITLLDLSAAAMAATRARLGPEAAGRVAWIVADVADWAPPRAWRLWHDRAAFHFLTAPEDRRAYVAAMAAGVAPGGTAVLMTFAEDGPERCSGLAVQRWSPEALAAEIEALAPGAFAPMGARRWAHRTPKGAEQRFQATILRRRGPPAAEATAPTGAAAHLAGAAPGGRSA